MEALILMAVTFALFWFLFIRPQQRRVREHQALIASLEEGDEVVTASGIFGTVRQLHPDVAHVEVAPGVVVKLARAAISRRVVAPGAAEGPEGDWGTDASGEEV